MLFERPGGGEKAILIHLHTQEMDEREDPQEFQELAHSAGAECVAFIEISRYQPSAKFLIGSGKVEELHAQVIALQAELVIVNHTLTPSQERNLERALECRVIDRTGLILDIFAQRARTHEGKLQVELAQLDHMSTRLVRGWTHLERQKGGIGLRGPGETQLETDRRLLRIRVKQLKQKLEKVRNQREQARRGRQRAEVPLISLVGYTNAGKSTLFNALTNSLVLAADQLFATLDPTLRRLELPDKGRVVFADTVGFIRHLPHKLVEAFRATLEESSNADLLIHVIDAHEPERTLQIEQVLKVLHEIGADKIPLLEVYNKIDLMDDVEPQIQCDDNGKPQRVWLSAQNNQGLDLLIKAIDELLSDDIYTGTLRLSPSLSKLRARFFETNSVQKEQIDEQGNSLLTIRISEIDLSRLLTKEHLNKDTFLKEYTI